MAEAATGVAMEALMRVSDLEAENERLRKLVEPEEWRGWDQVDSIYQEARLLRKERDELRAELKWIWDYAYGASGETGDDAGHLTTVGMRAKEALENARPETDEKENDRG